MAEKQYGCPVEVTLELIGGKWKCTILWWLRRGAKRFGELMQLMPGITQKVLTQQLRELEAGGLVHRQAYRESPPRVEYSLTAYGETLRPITELMCDWGKAHAPGFQFGMMGLTGIRILVIADSSEQSRLQRELGQVRQALVNTASAAAALAALNHNPPDIVLVDVLCSDDFSLLIQEVRQLETRTQKLIPVIALVPTSEDLDRIFAQGFRIHLVEPVEISELVAAIANLTGRLG
ncbi:winged helix-turn-helix transcriptional regulator [Pseudanabaena sp. FACHB-2040]|uniref:winged helix-turn-helix transcriptional regulator n=1 Tax=Pseudanabaena sp. FACHB-2040 TaxID=2692859 RepID=UPI001682AEB5|nr:winged helix-turn-helix transcriptional regulator [Pseudanabaena sp. FACHB-2040]MBD2258000.1 winged helix-turn-helix transcriptional regulator [Pseudanabaena sp. FACHB-2040]